MRFFALVLLSLLVPHGSPFPSQSTFLQCAASNEVSISTPPTFTLGTGFTQFLLSQTLAKAGRPSILMTSMAKKNGVRENWLPPSDSVLGKRITVVTNGEGEWEKESIDCGSFVLCNESADIPGKTLRALLDQMPSVKRIVIVSPSGTVDEESKIKNREDNWLFNRMMIMGGKRVGAFSDNYEHARDCERAAIDVVGKENVVVIHRGKLVGGGDVVNDSGLGEQFYKTCGSEPEVVLEKCYDVGRLGARLEAGDVIRSYCGDKEDRTVELEIQDKTHRSNLVSAIIAGITLPEGTSANGDVRRFSLSCEMGETISPLSEFVDIMS
mgnify:CR=1 FL=1